MRTKDVRKSARLGGLRRVVALLASAGLVTGGAVGAVALSATGAAADTVGPITFESGYATGSVNGQDGWASTGSFDQAVVDNSGFPFAPASFGTKSFRISDAVTSGSFADQTYTKSTTDAAGEPGANTGGFPTGTLRSNFGASFDFASTTPSTEQPGLHISVSPDRGDGARMSYVRIEDSPTGWQVFFDDVQDAPPYGSGGNLNDGCDVPVTGNFVETQIATNLSRSTPHNLRFVMKLVPGGNNDIVHVLLDGNLVASGTSWENYYRYCSESGGGTGGPLADQTRIVRNLELREGGGNDPLNNGQGFLFDGVKLTTNDNCTTTCYVDGATGDDAASGQANDPLKTIQGGVNAVTAGGTVNVAAGTYRENVVVPKSVRVMGAGVTTIVQPAVSDPNCGGFGGGSLCGGASSVFLVQSSNVTIDHLKIDGDNPTLTSTENIGGANIDARNGIITNHLAGLYNNLSVHDVTVKNVWLRGIYASSGGTFTISNNIVDNVNGSTSSIAIFDFGGGGTMSGNHVSNSGDGVSANHSNGTTFTGNVVTTSASGVHTDNAGDGGGTPDVISGNTVSSCTAGGYGIWTFVPYLVPTISGNTVSGCDTALAAFASCDFNGTNFCAGGNIPTVVFTTNTVTTVSGGFGLVVSTDTFGFGDGEVHVNAHHNHISGPGTGVYVEETGTATATLAANRNALVSLNNTGATTVNATCNWWGSTAGPTGGQVTGSATTVPFLRSSNLAAQCPATVPSAPAPAFAVPYNDHGAKVVWRAPTSNGGSAITGYRIVPYAGGVAQPAQVFNSTATTQFITGLTDGTSYQFTVAARNAVGFGPASAKSPAMIAGAPGQPGTPTVTRPASGSLRVAFAAPMSNGAPITSFSATCASSNGGVTKTKTGTASPITVTALTPGRSYQCTVTATNSRGTGPASNPSAAINA